MDSPKASGEQTPVLICPEYEHWITAASTAMRYHASQMTRAIQWAKEDDLSEERWQQIKVVVTTQDCEIP